MYRADRTGLKAVWVTGGTACCTAPRIPGSVTKPTRNPKRNCPAPARPATIHDSPTGVRAFLWSKRSMGLWTKGAIHGGIKGFQKPFSSSDCTLYKRQHAFCICFPIYSGVGDHIIFFSICEKGPLFQMPRTVVILPLCGPGAKWLMLTLTCNGCCYGCYNGHCCDLLVSTLTVPLVRLWIDHPFSHLLICCSKILYQFLGK